jgi:putative acetyltransferase
MNVKLREFQNSMNNKITIRPYTETDAPFLAAIYFHTIHKINAKDYSSEQLDAWAPNCSLETEGWMRKWQKLSLSLL